MEILFSSPKHKAFYMKNLSKCRCQDTYHEALIYCLGINRDTRKHIHRIYNFSSGSIKPECLSEGWQTSGSKKVTRLAFNLYCNGTPSIYNYEDAEEQLSECMEYNVAEIMCCGYAKYFMEAIKIRYPEYF